MAQTRYLIQVFMDDEFMEDNMNWTEEDVKELFTAFEEVLGGNYELEEHLMEIRGRPTYVFILVARPSCAGHVRENVMIDIYPKPDYHWGEHDVQIRFVRLTA